MKDGTDNLNASEVAVKEQDLLPTQLDQEITPLTLLLTLPLLPLFASLLTISFSLLSFQASFTSTSFPPSSSSPSLPSTLAAYCHLRCKNWVVRPGLQFGAHFAAYCHHPSLVHSAYSVVVVSQDAIPPPLEPSIRPLNSATLASQHKTATSASSHEAATSAASHEAATSAASHEAATSASSHEGATSASSHKAAESGLSSVQPKQWLQIQAISRVCSTVAKKLLILSVTRRARTSSSSSSMIVEAGSVMGQQSDMAMFQDPNIGMFSVHEMVLQRWIPERGREEKLGAAKRLDVEF